MKATATEAALRDFLLAFKAHAPVLQQWQAFMSGDVTAAALAGDGAGPQPTPPGGAAAIRVYREAFFERLAELRAGHGLGAPAAENEAGRHEPDEDEMAGGICEGGAVGAHTGFASGGAFCP